MISLVAVGLMQQVRMSDLAMHLGMIDPWIVNDSATVAATIHRGVVRTIDLATGEFTRHLNFSFGPVTPRVGDVYFELSYGKPEFGRVVAWTSNSGLLVGYGATTLAGNGGISWIDSAVGKERAGANLCDFRLKGIFHFASAQPAKSDYLLTVGERFGRTVTLHVYRVLGPDFKKALRLKTERVELTKGAHLVGYDPITRIAYSRDLRSVFKNTENKTTAYQLPPVQISQSWSSLTILGELYAWTYPITGEIHLPLLVKLRPNGQWQALGKLSLVGYSPSGKVILVKEPNGVFGDFNSEPPSRLSTTKN